MIENIKVDEEELDQTIEINGKEIKCIISMEECAELIQAISKMIRKDKTDKNYVNLTEEIADVLICLNMLTKIFNIKDEDIQKWIRYKQIRQHARDEDKINSDKL